MTTILTPEEKQRLLRALREDPDFRDEVRAQLLGREMLQVPERITALTAQVEALAATAREHTRHLQEHTKQLEEHTRQLAELTATAKEHTRQLEEHTRQLAELTATAKEHTKQLAELTAQLAELTATAKEHTKQFVELNATAKEQGRRIDNHTARFERMERDLGDIKGYYAESRPGHTMAAICDEMGFEEIRTVTPTELLPIARRLSLNPSQRRSFRAADLVFIAQDAAGNQTWFAVEISWTVGQRDIDRARRNAELLSQDLGRPAQAVVVGQRYDNELDWSGAAWVSLES